MPWMLGIDEAGYGPNLGPFVMSAVACQVGDPEADLWDLLSPALRRGGGKGRRAASSSMTPRSSIPAARGCPAWSAASSPSSTCRA